MTGPVRAGSDDIDVISVAEPLGPAELSALAELAGLAQLEELAGLTELEGWAGLNELAGLTGLSGLGDCATDPSAPSQLRELAATDAELDGVEALHRLASEILGQISTQDAWSGRSAALDAPHACGACGRWQRVRVPFLHHACETCRALWVPGHCSQCGRTAATLLSDFQSGPAPRCSCGSSLQRQGFIPRQRPAGAAPEPLAFAPTTRRRAGLTARISGVAAAMFAVVAAVAIATGQGSPDTGPVAAPAARPAHARAAVTPAERGDAAGRQLHATGVPATTGACTLLLEQQRAGGGAPLTGADAPLSGADRATFVSACTH